ncbi:MAG: DNA polymerase III subunit epsilon [Alphaproteobacteria bacterium]|nr:DNA polymerase III subunit epsilon [Alphaproteobacteria bacterium]
MREIVLDTETTGFKPEEGHRIVEIGCVELIDHIPTGSVYHVYINPERDMPEAAERVHGLSEEYLKTKPVFSEIAKDFLDYIADSQMVIHNAAFDMKFLNFELKKVGLNEYGMKRAIDTLLIARRKFPGQGASLDALCRRFAIDNSARTQHGALLDAELLAEVYLELIGGREPGFSLGMDGNDRSGTADAVAAAGKNPMFAAKDGKVREPRKFEPSEEELKAHEKFVADKIKDSIWD